MRRLEQCLIGFCGFVISTLGIWCIIQPILGYPERTALITNTQMSVGSAFGFTIGGIGFMLVALRLWRGAAMNGTKGTGDGTAPTNQNVILVVVASIAVNTTIALLALGWCLVTNTKTDATLLTAFVGLAGTLSGYLGGMLSRTIPSSATVPVQDVNMINPPSDPANVEIQPQPKERKTTK